MTISSQVPIPGLEVWQVSLGAKFIGILDPYENVQPVRFFGLELGYYADVYVYTWLGNPCVSYGTPIAQYGIYYGPSPRLNPDFDVGIHVPQMEFKNGRIEGMMFVSEWDIPATMGILKYIGVVRVFVSAFGVTPVSGLR